MSKADLKEMEAQLLEARRQLHVALECAGIVPAEALVDGTATAFRVAVWALESDLLALVRNSPEDVAISAAMGTCAKAWMAYSCVLPEDGADRRLVERAAHTLGHEIG